MSCECMEKIPQSIIDNQPFNGLKVTEAKIPSGFILANNEIIIRPLIEIQLTVEGRKMMVRKDLFYNFCPFCGKPYKPLPVEEMNDEKEATQ